MTSPSMSGVLGTSKPTESSQDTVKHSPSPPTRDYICFAVDGCYRGDELS